MPRVPRHTLMWSQERGRFEFYTLGQRERRFRPTDEAALLTWLGEATSFAFHGRSGSLNVYQETRPRGGVYWYAYHNRRGHTRKCYLGPPDRLSLARLEQTASDLAHEQQPRPLANQGMTQFATSKLAPPRLTQRLVARPRLLAALDEALATPLTLVSASAGWGKTTLLAAWASWQTQQKAHVAWLSLDELDNSPARFWAALIAALRRCGQKTSSLGATALALLRSPQPPPLSTIVTSLLNELESRAAHQVPLVLMLDDYQTISDVAIHESLRFLLAHMPATLHLIVATRADPDLPLAGLRARGQLTEIGMDDLRFQQDEARQFLDQHLAPALSDDEARQLTLRSEGWVAGLQLAALALGKCTDRAPLLQTFTGSQRYLVEYIQEEILARLPVGEREFLLRIAILSRLDAAMCQAVTAAPTKAECQRMLALLERRNLFLIPLDEERRWYRLHDLFREALLAVLDATEPDMARTLHTRAATFFEAHEEWSAAIAQRFASGEFAAAVRLMERTAERFWLHGEAATLAHWALALPATQAREHARLALTAALYRLFSVAQAPGEERATAYAEARQLMARAATALRPQEDEFSYHEFSYHMTPTYGAGDPALAADPSQDREDQKPQTAEQALLRRRLRLLRLLLTGLEATASGDTAQLNSMQQEVQEALDLEEELVWQVVPLACDFVLHYAFRQEGARLLPRLLDAKQRLSQRHSASAFATIKVRQWLALSALDSGRLRLAYDESQAALGVIQQMAGYAALKGYFELVQVEVLHQWNRLEEARGRLRGILRDASDWGQLDVLGTGYLGLMQVALATKDWPQAQQTWRDLEQLVLRERLGDSPDWLPAIRAWWNLAQGHVQAAVAWAAGVNIPAEAWERRLYDAFPILVRVYFAQHRWEEALALLERWSGRLDRPSNQWTTITYLAQALVALSHTGQREQARATAIRLFALTEPEGYLRVYLDEGEPMHQALLALLPARGHPHPPSASGALAAHTAYIATLLAAFEREQSNTGSSLEAGAAESPAPAVTLTRRERDVLRLLAAGNSNQEIAQVLMIELSTVKKHVSNLLGKLGVASRTQALVQARARGLI